MNQCQQYDLSALGMIRVSGEDAEHFLQGQLTNDVSQVAAGRSQLSGYCTPKGRMIASMRLLPLQGDFILLLPKERLPAVLQRLGMFVLMSKVTLGDASTELRAIGLSGDCGAVLTAGETPAEADDSITAQDGVTIVRLAGAAPRYLLVGPGDAVARRQQQLANVAAAAPEQQWWLLDIRAGLPTVFDRTAEAFVPQMLNMQSVNGVSFNKGCYTGQEVVARMQYLGKLKRRMYRVAIHGECPPPGTDLYSPQSSSGQGGGKIVMSAPTAEGGCEALAVVEVANIGSDEVRVADQNGAVVEFLQLPYAVEEKG
jgi:tRNA-modifying protein YgfZ